MTMERVTAFITWCIAVLVAWLSNKTMQDIGTISGIALGIAMLLIHWYYRRKTYLLLRDGVIKRGIFDSINR